MRFWDSSALVPLFVEEKRSAEMRQLLREDRVILASALTAVEVSSALWRRRHAGELSTAAHDEAERSFDDLRRRWSEVSFRPEMVGLAIDVLSRHPLRSMDALQLAAAWFATGAARNVEIVTLDRRLATAARAEGFPILP